MKSFSVLFQHRAVREIEDARAWLDEHRGQVRSAELDDALAEALRRLEALPDMGARVWTGSTWSKTLRRVGLGRTGYYMYYRVYPKAERIAVVCLWHERRRPPRL